MRVTGPDWPTTRLLKEALAGITSEKTLQWGHSPCDKLTALTRFRDAGLNTPMVTRSRADATRLGYWGRRINHSKGTDIAESPRSRKWAGSEFFVAPIPSTHDFRVHVWDGKCFRMGVKRFEGVGVPSLIRSSKRGWEICYAGDVVSGAATETQRTSLRDAARGACSALGVTGGAVDLLLGRDGRVWVLEVNTAPALGPFTKDAYVGAITKWATGGGKKAPSGIPTPTRTNATPVAAPRRVVTPPPPTAEQLLAAKRLRAQAAYDAIMAEGA